MPLFAELYCPYGPVSQINQHRLLLSILSSHLQKFIRSNAWFFNFRWHLIPCCWTSCWPSRLTTYSHRTHTASNDHRLSVARFFAMIQRPSGKTCWLKGRLVETKSSCGNEMKMVFTSIFQIDLNGDGQCDDVRFDWCEDENDFNMQFNWDSAGAEHTVTPFQLALAPETSRVKLKTLFNSWFFWLIFSIYLDIMRTLADHIIKWRFDVVYSWRATTSIKSRYGARGCWQCWWIWIFVDRRRQTIANDGWCE